MVKIHLKKKDVLLTVLEFLKSNGYVESMRCLEHESGLSVDNYGNDLDFLRELVLDGQWEDAENFVSPLRKKAGESGFNFERVMFELRKQRFLELVDGKDQEGAVLELTAGLKELEGRCSKEEFNKLCYCLTLESLSDHPDYSAWTPYHGRMECFTAIKHLFDTVFSVEWREQKETMQRVEPNHLITLLQQSALYQASLYMAATSTTTLPNPIHFDVLSPTFRPQDASGKALGPPGRRPHGEQSLVPGNVMRHMQRKLGAGGIMGAPLPVPGVVLDEANARGVRSSPARQRAGRAGQPLRSSWGYGNGRNALTGNDVSTLKKMAREYDKPREPLPLEEANKHAGKRAMKWEIPHGEKDEPMPIIDEDDKDGGMNLPGGPDPSLPTTKEAGPAEEAAAAAGGKTTEEKAGAYASKTSDPDARMLVKEVADSADDAPAGKTSEGAGHAQLPKPVEREGPLDAGRVRKLTCLAMSTESQPIRTVAFSPNGKSIAIGTNGCTLKICSVPGEQQCDQISRVIGRAVPATLKMKTTEVFEDLHLGSVYAASWSQDGSLIATGSNDMTVKVTRTGTGGDCTDEANCVTFEGHEGTIRDVAFCGDNNRVVSVGAGDFGVRVWDLSVSGEDKAPLMVLKGHTNSIMAVDCGITGEGGNTMVITAGMDRTIRLWDLRFQACVARLGCIGVGDKKFGAAGGDAGEASSEQVNQSAILALATNPLTPWTVASGHKDGAVCVWDLRAQRLSWSLRPHSDEVRSVDFSPDGRWMLSGSFDTSINCIDTDVWERRIVNTFESHKNKVLKTVWHSQRPLFASCSADKTVKIWGPIFSSSASSIGEEEESR